MALSGKGRLLVHATAILALPLAAVACGSSDAGGGGKVTINVAGMPKSETSKAAHDQFLADVAAFEKAHPTIDVNPSEYSWTADTFPARLASGQLETVFGLPFTEPQKLIAQQQVANITSEVKGAPELQGLNPKLLSVGQADGKTYGIPTGGYAVGLVYNRKLFKQAGLDPDRPPGSWLEVAAAAKKIAALGGDVAGYVPITQNNFGGWFLTMMNASYGNPMEVKGADGKYVASFNEGKGVAALTDLKNMRWADNTVGKKALLTLDDAQKLMATGKLGMFLGAGDWIGGIVTTYGGDRNDYGMGPMPQAGGNATLTGGSMVMVNPKATPAQRQAAVQWIAYEYLRTHSDPAAVKEQYAAMAKDPKAVLGFPELPLFTQQIQDQFEAARKPFVNVPTQHYATYVQSLSTLDYVAEPPVVAQNVYKILDSVIQKILTDANADPRQVLDAAAQQVNQQLATAQR
jgi:ABC-type glycerol-3-phosphate transport system substrate-binding protein